jgi:predicted aldo/keto reductase-like oxidoreductase
MAGGGFLDKEKTKPINTTAAIKWVLSNPNVHTTIPGMTNFDQLDLNIKILGDIVLNENERKDLAFAQAEKGLYCISCKNCISGCSLRLPIPEFMRAYMYAYGYSNPGMAYSLLNELSVGSNPCEACDVCSSSCSRNFNIKDKITDISRLVNVPSEFIL